MTRVLVVRLSAMGDVVEVLGAVAALLAARPELDICFVCQRALEPLLSDLPLQVLAHDRDGGAKAYLATCRRVRHFAPKVALDLQGNWKSAGVCWASRARERFGAAWGHRREPASALLLNCSVRLVGPAHPARLALAVVRAIAPEAAELPPRLVARPEEITAAAGCVRRAGLDPAAPFRVLVCSDEGDPRSWPLAAMAREAARAATPCLWLAGPDEKNVEPPAGVHFLRQGPGSLRELIGLGALVASRGGEVWGPDRGATHVLAASGAPTRVLFGPQDPARTAPQGSRVLVRKDGPACVPCRRRRCHHAEGPVCMDFDGAAAESPR